MSASKPPVITLRLQDVRALRLRGSGLETLRALAGPQARPLGHEVGPGYAFLAVNSSRGYEGLRALTRSFVFLPDLSALVTHDVADPETPLQWVAEGADRRESIAAESPALHVIQMGRPQPLGKIESEDLAGVRLADWVVLFHAETIMAQSAVSFDVAGPASLRFLVTGLAPGSWEIWRGGMRELEDGTVAPQSGAMCFAGKPGSYFLRRV